jgi:hypothetical protein
MNMLRDKSRSMFISSSVYIDPAQFVFKRYAGLFAGSGSDGRRNGITSAPVGAPES